MESLVMAKASSLWRNLFYNLSGPLLPFLMAGICIPVLIQHIGTDRFGLLTIAWTVIGYFSLFDFGLGRALTLHVSRYLGDGREHEVAGLVRSSLFMMGWLSLIGLAVVVVFAGEFVRWLKVPVQFVGETRTAFVLLGVSLPLVVLTSGMRGVLESFHRFDITNAIRMLQGLWTFTGPLCVLPFSNRLDAMVSVLVVGRLVTTIAYGVAVRNILPASDPKARKGAIRRKELLSYGGWTTLSNMLSPVMDYMDRFFISSLLGTAIVAFYTTPYEFVYRLNFISEGILGVLFPLMAKRLASSPGRSAAPEMLSLGTKLITASVFPFILILVLGAHPLLRLWLGPAFEQKSSLVLQLLAVGLLVNSLAKVPSNLIQANGRSDITAMLHIVELPVYIACLLWVLTHSGIAGAALIWALRMLLDFGLLLWMCRKAAGVPVAVVCNVAMLGIAQLITVGVAIFVDGTGWRVAYGAGVLSVLSLAFYRYVLLDTERLELRDSARRIVAILASKGVSP
jgi:O-antigen/teichoic acid export membrane protein